MLIIQAPGLETVGVSTTSQRIADGDGIWLGRAERTRLLYVLSRRYRMPKYKLDCSLESRRKVHTMIFFDSLILISMGSE